MLAAVRETSDLEGLAAGCNASCLTKAVLPAPEARAMLAYVLDAVQACLDGGDGVCVGDTITRSPLADERADIDFDEAMVAPAFTA